MPTSVIGSRNAGIDVINFPKLGSASFFSLNEDNDCPIAIVYKVTAVVD